MALAVIFLSINCLNAQKFGGGLSLGLANTDINGAENRHPHNAFHKLGYSVGGLLNIKLNPKWDFQFELNYTQKGSSLPQDINHVEYYKISLTYVEIPLLFKRRIVFNLPKKRWDKLELEAGFSIGKLINHTVKGYSNYVIPTSKDPFNLYEPAILLGASYRLIRNFYFCFRYSNAIIPVVKHNTLVTTSRPLGFNRGNNMVFLFSFKYIFRSGKESRNARPDATID